MAASPKPLGPLLLTINNPHFSHRPVQTSVCLSTICILVTPPALMIFSLLSSFHWVLSFWILLHTVAFLSWHQSLVSSFLCPCLPPPPSYRCADFLLKFKSFTEKTNTIHPSVSFSLPSISALLPGQNNKVTSLTLMLNSIASLVPSPQPRSLSSSSPLPEPSPWPAL